VISDEAIIEYFDNLADTTAARRPNYDAVLADATNGRLAEPQLMAQMRMELMAQRAQMMAQAGLYSAPPASLFEYYNRLNRRVTVDLLPVNVASLTSEVQDPTEAEVVALYEAGKNRFPVPTMPEPGFKQRKKIAFAYFQGVMEDFVQKEMAVIEPTITEEAIAAYYEQNKETEFKIPELPSAEEEAGKSTPEGGEAEETMPETTPETDKTRTDQGSKGDAGADDKSTETPTKQESAQEPKKDEPKKDEPKKDEPKKASDEKTGNDGGSGDDTDQASHGTPGTEVVFVSYTQDTTNSPPPQDPPKQDPPKEDPPKEDPPKEDPPKEDPPK
jgi:hypothetical protein